MEVAFVIKAKNAILQRFIESRGWSQSDFARAMGIQISEAGRWFNMQDYPRTKDKMFRLCKLVNAGPDDIFPEPLMSKEWLTDSAIRVPPKVTLYKDVEFLSLAACRETPALSPAPDAFPGELRGQVDQLIAMLTPREQKVIKMRFGIEGPAMTLDEIAQEFGLFRERVRQIEMKARRKMSHPGRRRKVFGDNLDDPF